jgi:hypothetical protein
VERRRNMWRIRERAKRIGLTQLNGVSCGAGVYRLGGNVSSKRYSGPS